MDQKRLLVVYAHPDDESFTVGGILRKYNDEGAKTTLLCATRGEKGVIHDPALATRERLGQIRERELREACCILGTEDLCFLGYPDGSLSTVDEVEAVGRIVACIRQTQPQIVVTFDANGDYGHPDHIAIHQLTVSAFHKAGDPTCFPEQLRDGLQRHTPEKLYAHAMAWSVMRKVYRQARAEGFLGIPGGSAATIPIAQMGTPDEEITTFVPLDRWQLAAKMAAMRAHRTQMDPGGPFHHFPNGAVREWLEVERFRLIYPPNAQAGEEDLFTGVT
jgi:LmbE family N-acetylglucosaminyl deacetylase